MSRLPYPQQSRAVLLGVSQYAHLDQLPAVKNNVDELRAALTDPRRTALPQAHCVSIVEPESPKAAARVLRTVAEQVEDTLIVYFAGHGRLNDRNELHLCLGETDPDDIWFTSLAYERVREIVANSPARNRIVILDCCFSGRAIGAMSGPDTLSEQTVIEGTYLLTATSANALALAPDGARFTAFTGQLLELLANGVPEGPELLSCSDMYRTLNRALVSRGLPQPRQQGSDTVQDLALSRNVAWRPRQVTSPQPVPHQAEAYRMADATTAALAPAPLPAPATGSTSTSFAGSNWKLLRVLRLLIHLLSLGFLSWAVFLALGVRSRRSRYYWHAGINVAFVVLMSFIGSTALARKDQPWLGDLAIAADLVVCWGQAMWVDVDWLRWSRKGAGATETLAAQDVWRVDESESVRQQPWNPREGRRANPAGQLTTFDGYQGIYWLLVVLLVALSLVLVPLAFTVGAVGKSLIGLAVVFLFFLIVGMWQLAMKPLRLEIGAAGIQEGYAELRTPTFWECDGSHLRGSARPL